MVRKRQPNGPLLQRDLAGCEANKSDPRSSADVTTKAEKKVRKFEPITVSIAEACLLTGLGRSTLYRLIAANALKTVKVGKRRLLPMIELRALFSAQ